MSGTIKSWLISGGSMFAGMACVIAVWGMIPREDDHTVKNKIRFGELSGQEQTDLRNKAKAFVDSTNESELIRLQQIHDAVESDPKLLTRLKSLDGLLASLDADTKAKLNPDGEFSSDWAQQVEILAQDKHAGDVTYEFPASAFLHWQDRGPSVVVDGHKFEAFLDLVSAQDWGTNKEYQKFINGSDRTTRRMFKTLALADRVLQGESAKFNSFVMTSAKDMLVPEGVYEDHRGRPPGQPSDHNGETERDQERERIRNQLKPVWANLQVIKILSYGLKNITHDFLSRRVQETVAPKMFTENFKRVEQMKLMTMAPADATQELNARLIQENNIHDPETARINEILTEAKSKLEDRSKQLMSQVWEVGRNYFESSRRGGRDGRGRDGRGRDDDDRGGDRRGGDGRGPREGGPREGGSGERGQSERGPNGRGVGGRGPGVPRFEDDRGPDGPARRGPENRPQGDRERDDKRPGENRPVSDGNKKPKP